jgi:hypothetical protein
MIEKIMSVFLDSDGDVTVLTARACYVYDKRLSEEQSGKLIKAVSDKGEIDTQYWKEEWEFNGVSLT